MDSSSQPVKSVLPSMQNDNTVFSKNTIIIVLLVLLILSVLGINLISEGEKHVDSLFIILREIYLILASIFKSLFGLLAYSFGATLNKLADILSALFITVIDISKNVIQRIGSIFMIASSPSVGINVPSSIPAQQNIPPTQVNTSAAPAPQNVQRPPDLESKQYDSQYENIEQWCYLGKHNGTRGCIKLEEHDKCMSGQIFPTEKLCLSQ